MPAMPQAGRGLHSVRKPAGKPAAVPRRAAPRLRVLNETWLELKKVVWPTRPEATNLTTIVIIVSAAVGVFLGLVDMGFTWLVNALLVRGG